MPETPRISLDIEALLGPIDLGEVTENQSTLQKDMPEVSGSLGSRSFDASAFLDSMLGKAESSDVPDPDPQPETETGEVGIPEEQIAIKGVQASTEVRKVKPQQPASRNRSSRGNGAGSREKRTGSAGNDDDSVRDYLNQIGKYPLLTKKDEVELAQKIEAGSAALVRLESAEESLSAEDRFKLKRDVREAKKAEQTFINSNLRLVVSIAKKYQASGLPLLDLVQEGNIGLMHGVQKFDWRKGFKFSTYGTWWIRQAITRGIANTGRTIRLPVHAGDELKKILKARTELKKRDVEPSIENIAEFLNIDPEKVAEALSWAREPQSLNQPLSDNKGSNEIGDLVADRTSADGYDVADKSDYPSLVAEALKCLDERELAIIRLRFGLDGDDPKKLQEIGEVFSLTRERIRQIEERALVKLRHPANGGALEALLNLA